MPASTSSSSSSMSREISHYVVTCHPPGAVLKTVKCNFLSKDSQVSLNVATVVPKFPSCVAVCHYLFRLQDNDVIFIFLTYPLFFFHCVSNAIVHHVTIIVISHDMMVGWEIRMLSLRNHDDLKSDNWRYAQIYRRRIIHRRTCHHHHHHHHPFLSSFHVPLMVGLRVSSP